MVMYIQQLYTNCLAQAAYYVESDREALIIDPLRDPAPYLEIAHARGATIKYVLETHFHADFVSGHLGLMHTAHATIVFGPGAKPHYPAHIATDGERLKLGNITIEVLHTPGHTIESCCYLLRDESERPFCVFTGDTLFAGDVGRPDLMSGNLDKETLASMLYDSLNKKIKTLPDEVLVYPGHGAGSACGKNIGPETRTTIGLQKKSNYALRENNREIFVRLVTTALPAPPPYFFKDAAINIHGYEYSENVLSQSLKPLRPEAFLQEMQAGALVLDTRKALAFSEGFVAGALNIGLDGDFAIWAGTLIPFNAPIVLVTEPGKERESIDRLARIGYENVKGYLAGGFPAWPGPSASIRNIDADDLKQPDHYVLLDVRHPSETQGNRMKGARCLPLEDLRASIDTLDRTKHYVVYCAGGYRSMMACSLLSAAGIHNVDNIAGGISRVKLDAPELIETTAIKAVC